MSAMLIPTDATTGDARLCWEWRNEPAARAASFDTSPIRLTEHTAWFREHITDSHARSYIVRKGEDAVAWVRFKWGQFEHTATVGVVVAPEWRGQGVGPESIALCCGLFGKDKGIHHIDAFVKRGNEASIKAFKGAGFHVAASMGDVVIMRNYGVDQTQTS